MIENTPPRISLNMVWHKRFHLWVSSAAMPLVKVQSVVRGVTCLESQRIEKCRSAGLSPSGSHVHVVKDTENDPKHKQT